MNTTLQVASLFDCDHLDLNEAHGLDSVWRQTVAGCKMLDILRDMYGFSVSYVIEDPKANMTTIDEIKKMTLTQNVSIDMYLRPMSFRMEHLEIMRPIHEAYSWRLGFILLREDKGFYRYFYSKPFTRPVWNCLYLMAFFISMFFYFLKKWEVRILGGFESSYTYELLMVVGAYCQHIPPIEAVLPSRRIAYLSFFLFAYIIYTYYTSNLLSHLVNDKDSDITLHSLSGTGIEPVILDYMTLTISENIPSTATHYNVIVRRIHKLRVVGLQEGLNGVKNGKFALLSDYISVYPALLKSFTDQEVCEITKLDIFSHVKKYFFVAKHMPYKEELKIGLLRAEEAGILKRWLVNESEIPKCVAAVLVQIKFVNISTAMISLLATYLASVFILILERAHYQYYKRNRVWPYTE